MSAYNEHQFGEMHRRLSEEGGFTYNPRSKQFVSSGYSVAAHPAAELRIPQSETSHAALAGYVAGSAPTWKGEGKKGAGQEMIGGWRSEHHDVLDIPKVFPATPSGHTKSRRAQVLRGQEASFSLHEGAEDVNPFHPSSRLSEQFPEFSRLAANRPEVALEQPEIAAWAEGPSRKAAFQRGHGK